MYLSLDKLQSQIDEWQQKSYKDGAWSSNGFNIAQSWIKTGLEPRGITRDLKFGTPIPLPGYENKVMYVWFDACIGYVSITATYTKEWEKWWRNPEDVQLYQFMGKDNTPFHAVVFPGSQLGTKEKWTMVHHISTTEYLNYERGKFSKSRGIGVFGTSAKEIGISPDVWRYYLLSHRPETGDSEFEWEAFVLDNNYLLNNLGNLVNRTVKFTASKTYDSVVPDYTEDQDPLFEEFKKNVNDKLKDYIDAFEKVKLRGALQEAMATSQLGNKLLQDVGLDNRLAQEQPKKCAALVGIILNHLHLIAAIIAPYMPGTSKSILEQLNAKPLSIPETFAFNTIPVGHKIGAPAYLFTNIKAEKAAEWRDQFGGEAARKAKEEAARLAAEKKASKKKGKDGGESKSKQPELTPEEEQARIAAKKAAKAAKKEKGRQQRPGGQPADEGKGVEAAEKEGVAEEGIDEVEEIAEGVKVAKLQSS
jgi:methionyl-tRNA synthetase